MTNELTQRIEALRATIAELTERVNALEAREQAENDRRADLLQDHRQRMEGLREVPQRSATYPFTTRDESHRPAPTPAAPDFALPLRRGEKVPR